MHAHQNLHNYARFGLERAVEIGIIMPKIGKVYCWDRSRYAYNQYMLITGMLITRAYCTRVVTSVGEDLVS